MRGNLPFNEFGRYKFTDEEAESSVYLPPIKLQEERHQRETSSPAQQGAGKQGSSKTSNAW